MSALNDTLDQMHLTDIYRQIDIYGSVYTCHPKEAEYIFFPSARGIFPKTDYMLGHKTSLNKFNKTEITSSIFSDHNGMELEVNYKKKARKFTNMWKLNMLLNNQWVTE